MLSVKEWVICLVLLVGGCFLPEDVVGQSCTTDAQVSLCGTAPTQKNVIIRRRDSSKTMTQKLESAQEGQYVYIEPMTKVMTLRTVYPKPGVTIWADIGSGVTWNGRGRGRALAAVVRFDMDPQVPAPIRVYGITFINFALERYEAIIEIASQNFNDTPNFDFDPIWGYNPPTPWLIDCNVFQAWRPKSRTSRGGALQVSSLCKARGNIFRDGKAIAIWGQGYGIEITGNRFLNNQPSPSDIYRGFHGNIKLLASKRVTVTNNIAQDTAAVGFWFDANCEDIYVAFNQFKDIGFSCVHYEVSGGGTVIEHNVCEGWGVNPQLDPSRTTKAAFWMHTAGGSEYSNSGTLIQGNYAIVSDRQRTVQRSYKNPGFMDYDASATRDPYGSPPLFGKIRDASGFATTGTKWRTSDDNRWFGNVATGTTQNGVTMEKSKPDAKTYLTSEWQGNIMEGRYLFNTLGKKAILQYKQAWQRSGRDTVRVTFNKGPTPGVAFGVVVSSEAEGFKVELTQTQLSPQVNYLVSSQPCGGPFSPLSLEGTLQRTGDVVRLDGCSCRDIIVRALYNGMYGAFVQTATHRY